jgi:hypothetical protein
MLEILLRFQQKLGPLYDLEFNQILSYSLSDTLNHIHSPGEYQYSIIIGSKRFNIKKCFDQNGIRVNKLIPHYPDDQMIFKILFMGDSFMEGFDDENTIPYRIWQNFQHKSLRNLKINFLNAGCSSYSPAVYIPQAKLLIPQLKPDIVVIDIDESDLLDDSLKYKDCIVRNDSGDIIAVKYSSAQSEFLNGFIKIKKYPLYIIRLPLKLCHTKIYPLLIDPNYRRIKSFSTLKIVYDRDKDAISKYAKEIEFFKKNLTELVRNLINMMKDKRKILFIYHSHPLRIQGDATGFYGNSFVSDTLKEVLNEQGISFYDATGDLRSIFKNQLGRYYFRRDPVSHFNFEGMKIYSNLVAQKLIPMIEVLVNEKK